MRRVILCIAASVDGYIAAPDGGAEWPDKYRTDSEDYVVSRSEWPGLLPRVCPSGAVMLTCRYEP